MSEVIDLKEETPVEKCRQQEAWEELGKAWGADTLIILNKDETFDYCLEYSKHCEIKAKKGYVLTWKGKKTNI